MTKSYYDFKSRYLGQYIDLDGYPRHNPFQCWDGAMLYAEYVGGHRIHCPTDYVIDVANYRDTNGILDFCYDVGLNATLQPGDICVWGFCPACPSSHIAIYDSDEGQNCVYFLGQNQPHPFMSIARIDVSGIIGVFRPKIFSGDTPTPHKPDQILSVGSKVKSAGFYVQALDYINDMMHNSNVGEGYFPCADVDEIDSNDGSCDQYLHIGSGVAFNFGTATVTGIEQRTDGKYIVYLDKLDYPIFPDLLVEVED